MKKSNRSTRKSDTEISIAKMDERKIKFYISTGGISAVRDDENVQNYENYINEKYLTGAIVDPRTWNEQKKRRHANRSEDVQGDPNENT